MSDLNDLIARNAVMAYNEGLERGASMEMDRIISLIESKRCECLELTGDSLMKLIREDERLAHARCEWAEFSWIIQVIKGETDGQNG
jgi:hypothetical protein